jgi:UDP-N-acetyl-D-mannosaminuronic acid dehydrogenase
MPAYAVGVLQEMLGGLEGRRVLILGVAYRGGVKETAFSGAMPLRDNLRARGAIPVASDPLYDAEELRGLGFEAWDGMPVHGAIVQADHAEYRGLGPAELPEVTAVVDGRGVLDAQIFGASGVEVRRLGGGPKAWELPLT